MSSPPSSIWQAEERLGQLAAQFRGTRSAHDRQAIADAYLQAVENLIASGRWHEMPPPEDQLPDGCMPTIFFEYWLRRQGVP